MNHTTDFTTPHNLRIICQYVYCRWSHYEWRVLWLVLTLITHLTSIDLENYKLLLPNHTRNSTSIKRTTCKTLSTTLRICLHFPWLRKFVMVQAVEIIPRGGHGTMHHTPSVTWLLMAWRRKSPRHQQPWYWPRSHNKRSRLRLWP